MAESGPLALLGYAYSAHQGQINRGLTNGLFHALGCSRLRGGTVCDSCADAAWAVTVGDIGGADPESVHASDLIVSWSSDLHATNVHLWAAIEKRRAAGVKLVVIDPRRTRSARVADLWLPVRIGTDSALALGVMHILVRDGRADRDYLARHTLGFDQVEREVLPRFTPEATAAITGLPVADIETFAAMYGDAADLVHPHRLRAQPLHRRRAEPAHRRVAAGRDRRLWPLRRRRVGRHRGGVRTELQRAAQAVRPGRNAAPSTI